MTWFDDVKSQFLGYATFVILLLLAMAFFRTVILGYVAFGVAAIAGLAVLYLTFKRKRSLEEQVTAGAIFMFLLAFGYYLPTLFNLGSSAPLLASTPLPAASVAQQAKPDDMVSALLSYGFIMLLLGLVSLLGYMALSGKKRKKRRGR